MTRLHRVDTERRKEATRLESDTWWVGDEVERLVSKSLLKRFFNKDITFSVLDKKV